MYRVVIPKDVKKSIQRLDKPTQKRILNAILSLAENPYGSPNVKRLKGYKNTYRQRVGDFRIIFDVVDRELIIVVVRVGSRGDVYKD